VSAKNARFLLCENLRKIVVVIVAANESFAKQSVATR